MVLVRAMAVAGMYVAGPFLTLAWISVFNRLYAIFVRLLLPFAPSRSAPRSALASA
ncbi:MAG: hypothetical protein ABEJ23_08135 [Haloarculaceae archaeon]